MAETSEGIDEKTGEAVYGREESAKGSYTDDDEDITIRRLNRRFTDHVTFTRFELEGIHRGINNNTEAVNRLAGKFELHDSQEMLFRDTMTESVKQWTVETINLNNAMRVNEKVVG